MDVVMLVLHLVSSGHEHLRSLFWQRFSSVCLCVKSRSWNHNVCTHTLIIHYLLSQLAGLKPLTNKTLPPPLPPTTTTTSNMPVIYFKPTKQVAGCGGATTQGFVIIKVFKLKYTFTLGVFYIWREHLADKWQIIKRAKGIKWIQLI